MRTHFRMKPLESTWPKLNITFAGRGILLWFAGWEVGGVGGQDLPGGGLPDHRAYFIPLIV